MAARFGLLDAARDDRILQWVTEEPEHACLFGGRVDPVLAKAAKPRKSGASEAAE